MAIANPDRIFAATGTVDTKQIELYEKRSLIRLLVFEDPISKKRYSCFMVMVAGESHNLQQSPLNDLHYKAYKEFTGVVDFYSMDGELVNGWSMEKGKVVGSRKPGVSRTSSPIRNQKLMNVLPPENCNTREDPRWRTLCNTVYPIEGMTGEPVTTCRQELYYVTVVISCPDEDGDGGYVPPHGGTDPNDPEPPQQDSLQAIAKDTCLNATQMQTLRNTFNSYLNGEGDLSWACLHKAIYGRVLTSGKKIGFCINTINGSGTYNALTSTITYGDELGLTRFLTLRHEFFHVYQDTYYTGGTSQYNSGTRTGYPNLEFEQALFNDILDGSDNASAMGSTASNSDLVEYRNWVKSITNNNTSYPTQFSDFGGQYYYFLNKFYAIANHYSGIGIVKSDLPPNALLNIFNTTNCKLNY